MPRADRGKQGLALCAGRGVGTEVHVLDHQIHRLALQNVQTRGRRFGMQGADVVQREQHFQRGGYRRVVVDDKQGRHAGRQSMRSSRAIVALIARAQRRDGRS